MISDSAAQRIGGVVYGLRNNYDGVAMGRGLRSHSDLWPCYEGGQGLAHRPVLLSERGGGFATALHKSLGFRDSEVYHAGRVLHSVR